MIPEILKYTIPALIVFLTTYLVLSKVINNEFKRQKAEIALNNQKIITPIRVQAYERMILFLERIAPQSIVLRTQKPKMTSKELQTALLKTIRTEFEHNMAHQLYISDKAWEMVKTTKENMVKQINQRSLRIKPDAPAIQLSKLILEEMLEGTKDPTRKTIQYIKSEVRTLF